MNHTLFYFSSYRVPKYSGSVAVRFYSKHFRNGKGWLILPFPLKPLSFYHCERAWLSSECVLSQAAEPCSHCVIFYIHACKRHVKMENWLPSGLMKKLCL